jgi:hypothetical protein
MSATPLSRTLVILTALAFSAACSDPVGPRLLVDDGGEQESEALSVTPRTATIEAGGVVLLHAKLVDGSGKRIPAVVQWTSSRDAVATVTASGEVQGRSAGRAIITARAAGKRQTAIIHVLSPKPEKDGGGLPQPALRLR